MTANVATALAQAAGGLKRATRFHKQESARHRRLARQSAREYDRLMAQCRELGIAIEVIDTDQGGQSHDDS